MYRPVSKVVSSIFEAIVSDNQSKPQSGAVSGAFHTPQVAATALISKLYGSRR
jgi:hypothetical protein